MQPLNNSNPVLMLVFYNINRLKKSTCLTINVFMATLNSMYNNTKL